MSPVQKTAALGAAIGLTVGAFAGALLGLLGPVGACVLVGLVLSGAGGVAGALYAEGEKR